MSSGPEVFRLELGDLSVEGASRAGEETWFRVDPPGLAFDVGRGPNRLLGAKAYCLSHGHLDHLAGLPFLLSQRRMHRLGPVHIFCPVEIVEALGAYLAGAERLEGVEYQVEIRGLHPGEGVELGRLRLEAFATDHVVPSRGYHLFSRKHRLAKHLEGLSRSELLARKAAGEELSEAVERLELSFCGDTGPGVFELEPRIFSARVLMVECTFLGEGFRESAREYGHLHLEDLAARMADFENEELVLFHLSRRHRRRELENAVAARLPGLKPRVHLVADR